MCHLARSDRVRTASSLVSFPYVLACTLVEQCANQLLTTTTTTATLSVSFSFVCALTRLHGTRNEQRSCPPCLAFVLARQKKKATHFPSAVPRSFFLYIDIRLFLVSPARLVICFWFSHYFFAPGFTLFLLPFTKKHTNKYLYNTSLWNAIISRLWRG